MGDALDELLALLELEALEVNLFRGREPRRGPPARVRRPGRGAGARRRRPHRRRRTGPCTRCTRTSCGPAIRTSRSSTRSTASATGRASPPGGSWRSSTGARSSTWRRRSRSSRAAPTTRCRCPTSRDPRRSRRSSERVEPYLERFGPDLAQWLVRERPIDSRPVDDPRWLDPSPREPQQDVWIKANGDLPDDSAAARVRRRLRVRPHAARHRDVPARDLVPGASSTMIASLDHAMWFHRPFRADDWLLYHQTSPSASRRTRARARLDLLSRRHARDHGDPGGADPPDREPVTDARDASLLRRRDARLA